MVSDNRTIERRMNQSFIDKVQFDTQERRNITEHFSSNFYTLGWMVSRQCLSYHYIRTSLDLTTMLMCF